MTSDTRNVKVGPCRIYYDGADLGYTKGGVEAEVTSETYKSEVDQFGKTPISETITARMVKVKVPLAETTVENMARVMPGATIVAPGGVKATGTITLGSNPTNGQTVLVNGKTITFKTAATGALDVTIAGSAGATAAALAAVLNASQDSALNNATYTVAAAVVTVTYDNFGTAGNSFTLAAGTSGATVSGATLSGGATPTSMRVEVTDGVGLNLLAIAKELRLHPMDKPDDDKSDDFVIPLAATPGGVNFSYKLEEERVYSCEFTGYPDPATRRLYYVGS